MAIRVGPDDPSSRLSEMRAAAVRRAASLEVSFDAVVEAASDVATDDEHDPEGHTIAWERQQLAALLDETRISLQAIDAAEGRIEAGTYGVCTVCGCSVSDARLAALPAAETCVGCAG